MSCPICREEVQLGKLDCCVHEFCPPCMREWASRARPVTCPLCRRVAVRCGGEFIEQHVERLPGIVLEPWEDEGFRWLTGARENHLRRYGLPEREREIMNIDMEIISRLRRDDWLMNGLSLAELAVFDHILQHRKGFTDEELRLCYKITASLDAYAIGVGLSGRQREDLRELMPRATSFKSMLAHLV